MRVQNLRRYKRRIIYGFVVVAALGAATVALPHHGYDNMFKTANYNGDCVDGSLNGVRRFCQTDNATLTVWRGNSLTSTGKTNIASVLNTEFNPTDLNVTYVDSPVYTGGAETDIIYQERDNLPNDAFGITWCNDAVSDTKCDQHYVAFESATPGKGLACHETGHAVGLTHGAQASPKLFNNDQSLYCMRTTVPPADLGPHNTHLVNLTYPN